MSLIDIALDRSRTVILTLILLLVTGWVGYKGGGGGGGKMPNGFCCVQWNRNFAPSRV